MMPPLSDLTGADTSPTSFSANAASITGLG